MPSTSRAIEGILTLLQILSIVLLSVGSLRVRHWFAAPTYQVPPGRGRGLELTAAAEAGATGPYLSAEGIVP
jgi:hypothetical protein